MSEVILNENEAIVFKAIRDDIQEQTAGEFGWGDHVALRCPTLRKAQVAGYCSSLASKGLYVPCEDGAYTQTMMTKLGVEVAKQLGDNRSFSVYDF